MPVMTYLKEQDIYAWASWLTPGDSDTDKFISIATIPESGEHIAYIVTRRTMPGVKSGNWFYMIERVASRNWIDADAEVDGTIDPNLVWCLDSAVEFLAPASTTLTGLHHLIGATVICYVDGGLQASKVVTAAGTITLDRAAATRALVGLPYTPQMQTLRLDLGEPSVQGRRKKVAKVSVTMNNSRGAKVASMKDLIDGSVTVGTLIQLKERSSDQTYSSALPFISGVRTLNVPGGYQVDGSVFVEGTPGLPLEILALTPTVTIGDEDN